MVVACWYCTWYLKSSNPYFIAVLTSSVSSRSSQPSRLSAQRRAQTRGAAAGMSLWPMHRMSQYLVHPCDAVTSCGVRGASAVVWCAGGLVRCSGARPRGENAIPSAPRTRSWLDPGIWNSSVQQYSTQPPAPQVPVARASSLGASIPSHATCHHQIPATESHQGQRAESSRDCSRLNRTRAECRMRGAPTTSEWRARQMESSLTPIQRRATIAAAHHVYMPSKA